MDAEEKISRIVYDAVDSALPAVLYDVCLQTVSTSIQDQCIITIVVREKE